MRELDAARDRARAARALIRDEDDKAKGRQRKSDISRVRDRAVSTANPEHKPGQRSPAREESQPPESPTASRRKRRKADLARVFREFDLDGNGVLEKRELMQLGKARRAAGHRPVSWTEELSKMLDKMDLDKNGVVDEQEFISYFAEALPMDETSYAVEVAVLMDTATACRRAKVSARRSQRGDEPLESSHTSSRSPPPAPTTPPPATQPDDRSSSPLSRRRWDPPPTTAPAPAPAAPTPTAAPPPVPGSTINARKQRRLEELRKVFLEFDMDRSGYIEAAELLRLGQARREMGHREGTWTEEENRALVTRMDTDGDGKIDQDEFMTFFEAELPRDEELFMSTVSQFAAVARQCRAKTRSDGMYKRYEQMQRESATPPSRSSPPKRVEAPAISFHELKDANDQIKRLKKQVADLERERKQDGPLRMKRSA